MSDHPDDDLDRLIDALNTGNLDPAAVTDPELADLLSVATEVRRGGEPEWPDADFPARLARGVVAALRSSTAPVSSLALGDAGPEHRHDEPAPDGEPSERGVAVAPGRRWAREVGQLAAAVLVLVVVGGVLAAVLRGHGSQGGATPGSGSGAGQLPITVTASGIPITLESVVATSTSTRFTLSVQLPPYAARQAAEPLIPPAAADVHVTGVVDAAPLPEFAQGPHQPGQAAVNFSLTFASPVQPNQTVTLSLSRLGFAAPSEYALPPGFTQRPGPWTFAVPPAMLTEQLQPLPTPNPSGIYTGLTFGQAQLLVAFPIVEPRSLPNVLTREGSSVTAFVLGSTGPAKANWIRLFYPAAETTHGVTVDESTTSAIVPTVRDGVLHLLEAPSKPAVFTLRDASWAPLTIQGVIVAKLTTLQALAGGPPTGSPVTYYSWSHAGVFSVVSASPSAPVTDPVLQQVVTSMIASEGTHATPPGSPATATMAALARQVAFPIFVPTAVPAGLTAEAPAYEPMQSAPINLRYRAADGTLALEIVEGSTGCCLDSDPRKTGEPVIFPNGHTAHYLNVAPQFGGPILWWQQDGTYLAISGPHLTQDDLMRVARSMGTDGEPGVPIPATPQARATPTNLGMQSRTPTTAFYKGLTVAQAQALVPFRLISPAWLPASLHLLDVQGVGPPIVDPATGNLSFVPTPMTSVRQVSLIYGPGDLGIVESGSPMTNSFPGTPTTTTLSLGGQSVTRTVYHDGALSYEHFTWQEHGTYVDVSAEIRWAVTESVVEHMIASMLP